MILEMLLSAFLAAQAAPPRVAPVPQDPDASALAIGWNALAVSQYPAASRAADAVLQRRPWDHAALALKIQALSAMAPGQGLDAYEQWLGRGHDEDLGLLAPVTIAVLREIAAAPADAALRVGALEALTAAHVPGAAEQQAALGGGGGDAGLEREIGAARGGDTAAVQQLTRRADPRVTPRNAALARALAAAGDAAGGPLQLMLESSDAETRAAAAQSLGVVKSAAARAALQKANADPDPRVRTSATVALARLGDPAAMATAEAMLQSGVPEVQIAAAEAWDGREGPWVAVVRSLLGNQDGLTRIEAARVLAPVDAAAATATLSGAAEDPNPVVRAEAVSALGALDPAAVRRNVAALRRALRDRDPMVRAGAAKVLLSLARA